MKNRLIQALVVGLAAAGLLLGALPAQAAPLSYPDPVGDATDIGVGEAVVPNDPAFDITKVTLKTAGDKFVWTTDVPGMTSGQPTLSTGYYFRYWFAYEGADYQFIVAEDVTGAKTFSMSQRGTTTVALTDKCKDCKGVVNREAKAVQVEVPISSLDAAFAFVKAPPVAGKDFTKIQVLSQRRTGAVTLTSDTATATEGAAFTF